MPKEMAFKYDMRHYCKPENVLLFDAISETEKVLSVKNLYWGPNELVIKMIEQVCVHNKHKRILEIGPGMVPFHLATDWIGSNEKITNYIDIDIDKEKIPYDINHFDFVYCRHVLEDIQNPDFVLKEIIRVSKYGGYMETPSPLIEITKDVDSSALSNMYSGYIHHRYIVWSNIQKMRSIFCQNMAVC